MTFDQFVKAYDGEAIDVDGCAGVQCVDLAKAGLKEVFGIGYFSWNGSARNLFEHVDQFPQMKDFVKINNTKTFIPRKADLCFWNKNVGNGNGHVAWSMGSDEDSTSAFYSFDQNWSGKAAHIQKHSYSNFSGVLRHKSTCKKTTTADLNVRSGTGTNYPIVDELPKGSVVYDMETIGTWTRIGDNRWVSNIYLK